MKFGKEFKSHLEDTIPDWRDKFLCYKPLKKLLKHLPSNNNDDESAITLYLQILQTHFPHRQPPPSSSPRDLESWFVTILNEELDKFNDFYVDKEEEFVIRLQELKVRIEQLKEKSSQREMYTSEDELSKEMMEIRKDLVTIHGEMVLLKNYSSLNFAGLIKILKKYDKRTGRVLQLPFTQVVLRQPVFSTEPLTRLVRECEENLELLFPLQAEVIQTVPALETQSRSPIDNAMDVIPEAPTNLGEETVEIYRSTLAAMKAIKGLQKESSTSNPFSFSKLYTDQDADSAGAVTAESSAANSPCTLQNEEGTGKGSDSA